VPLLCAGTIIILLPTLVIFMVFQRQIITALLQGSVKG
jgi:raffinose/stachyose/melibiose transport system permease protein